MREITGRQDENRATRRAAATAESARPAREAAPDSPVTAELNDRELDAVSGGDWLMMPAGHARGEH